MGQRSEDEALRLTSDNQVFVADFSQFSPKVELSEAVGTSEHPPTATALQHQQFTGVCGAFQIYRKPSPSKTNIRSI